MSICSDSHALRALGLALEGRRVAGVDEAGRGPLAGPVVAAAVILHPRRPIDGLDDSKKLSAAQRNELAHRIKTDAWAWALGQAEAAEIDRINILQATLLAMRRAVAGLALAPDIALIDGNRCPSLSCPSHAIVRGDSRVAAIAAASILAKVDRDRQLVVLHREYPHYGFDRHKGYPTRAHIAALALHGVTAVHRRSFAPVRAVLKQTGVSV